MSQSQVADLLSKYLEGSMSKNGITSELKSVANENGQVVVQSNANTLTVKESLNPVIKSVLEDRVDVINILKQLGDTNVENDLLSHITDFLKKNPNASESEIRNFVDTTLTNDLRDVLKGFEKQISVIGDKNLSDFIAGKTNDLNTVLKGLEDIAELKDVFNALKSGDLNNAISILEKLKDNSTLAKTLYDDMKKAINEAENVMSNPPAKETDNINLKDVLSSLKNINDIESLITEIFVKHDTTQVAKTLNISTSSAQFLITEPIPLSILAYNVLEKLNKANIDPKTKQKILIKIVQYLNTKGINVSIPGLGTNVPSPNGSSPPSPPGVGGAISNVMTQLVYYIAGGFTAPLISPQVYNDLTNVVAVPVNVVTPSSNTNVTPETNTTPVEIVTPSVMTQPEPSTTSLLQPSPEPPNSPQSPSTPSAPPTPNTGGVGNVFSQNRKIKGKQQAQTLYVI
ncbi:hypothetical protein [Metallosphaera hakonensis]|uniref:Uncharacterized protein n=2 Tax=Metallosphaera hakonensis TaxID=79601 RepID=A0A2U9IQS6_9CREN|nr:hypothetical protein [Metallosphaera hakonensis]AWR98381.1 hypothetical protein DFR87_00150 [Metallosphaera hakonensis JCM 8857 = DSM 7519]